MKTRRQQIKELRSKVSHLENRCSRNQKDIWTLQNPSKYKIGEKIKAYDEKSYKKAIIISAEVNTNYGFYWRYIVFIKKRNPSTFAVVEAGTQD
jgi:hypothetical protein